MAIDKRTVLMTFIIVKYGNLNCSSIMTILILVPVFIVRHVIHGHMSFSLNDINMRR